MKGTKSTSLEKYEQNKLRFAKMDVDSGIIFFKNWRFVFGGGTNGAFALVSLVLNLKMQSEDCQGVLERGHREVQFQNDVQKAPIRG